MAGAALRDPGAMQRSQARMAPRGPPPAWQHSQTLPPTMKAFPQGAHPAMGGSNAPSRAPSAGGKGSAEALRLLESSDSDSGQEPMPCWPRALLAVGALSLLTGLGLLALNHHWSRAPGPGPGPGPGPEEGKGKPILPQKLTRAGNYDLRALKNGKLIGCAAPIGLFPGQPKYGCSGEFSTAQTCDAAAHPVKDTAYVRSVHDGCETAAGRGTYGYAYDDGVGLKQCSPLTKYEWVLCPVGTEEGAAWPAEPGPGDSLKRFRVTNRCREAVWIQQAGAQGATLEGEPNVRKIEPGASYTYAIPNKGLPSTRFLPKTGCDATGNGCDVQSMPPCPKEGCDLPIDTKFEASWGCKYWTGTSADGKKCALTGQGNPSTYQDWWDGSAVDGWTLPFSVLVDDGGHGLAPTAPSNPKICSPVVCAGLKAESLCPQAEFLTPES